MLHLASVRIFSKAVATLVPDFVRIGTAQARLLKTSIQVSKYLIPSLNDERLERSTRSIWYRSPIPFRLRVYTSCDEENKFSWVCVEYMHLVWLEIRSLRVRTSRCNVARCLRHRNYLANAERSTLSSEVQPSVLGLRPCVCVCILRTCENRSSTLGRPFCLRTIVKLVESGIWSSTGS